MLISLFPCPQLPSSQTSVGWLNVECWGVWLIQPNWKDEDTSVLSADLFRPALCLLMNQHSLVAQAQWWPTVDSKITIHLPHSLFDFILIESSSNYFWVIDHKISSASFDGLVEERGNSIANALELSLSCTNPSVCSFDLVICKEIISTLHDVPSMLAAATWQVDAPHIGLVMWTEQPWEFSFMAWEYRQYHSNSLHQGAVSI